MNIFKIVRLSIYVLTFLGVCLRGIEQFYVFLFKKPLFIHFSFFKKKLSKRSKSILEEKVSFYKKLNQNQQSHFEHRLVEFIRKYDFIGREGYVINSETKVLIGSVYVMLTFGMRKYLTDCITKIVVYPDLYLSKYTNLMYKGEYNPAFKLVVFSWKDFTKGIVIDNDNLHLGIHEFAHVLSFHTKISDDVSSRIFYKNLQDIFTAFDNQQYINELKEIAYFRKYAFTNKFEFIAVVLECFFETRKEFQEKSPVLYNKILDMLNYRFLLNQQ